MIVVGDLIDNCIYQGFTLTPGLPLPTSFGGLHDYLTIEICKFVVITSVHSAQV